MRNATFVKDPATLRSLTFTAAGTIYSGEIALVGDTYVISYEDLAAGEIGSGVYECQACEIPKATGASIAGGKWLWLDPVGLVVYETTAVGYVKVGIARESASSAATHVLGYWKGYQL